MTHTGRTVGEGGDAPVRENQWGTSHVGTNLRIDAAPAHRRPRAEAHRRRMMMKRHLPATGEESGFSADHHKVSLKSSMTVWVACGPCSR